MSPTRVIFLLALANVGLLLLCFITIKLGRATARLIDVERRLRDLSVRAPETDPDAIAKRMTAAMEKVGRPSTAKRAVTEGPT